MLLGMHIFLVALFLPEWITYLKSFANLRQLEKDLFSKQKEKLAKKKNNQSEKVCDHSFILLFVQLLDGWNFHLIIFYYRLILT